MGVLWRPESDSEICLWSVTAVQHLDAKHPHFMFSIRASYCIHQAWAVVGFPSVEMCRDLPLVRHRESQPEDAKHLPGHCIHQVWTVVGFPFIEMCRDLPLVRHRSLA